MVTHLLGFERLWTRICLVFTDRRIGPSCEGLGRMSAVISTVSFRISAARRPTSHTLKQV